MRPEFFGLVRQFVEAWNRHDLTTLENFYAPNVVREGPGGIRSVGIDSIRKIRQNLLNAFPDIKMDYRHQFTVGTHGVLEWTFSGTHRGAYETPWGSVPATGKKVEWTGTLIWEMDDKGFIIYERLYFDQGGLLAQLNALKVALPV